MHHPLQTTAWLDGYAVRPEVHLQLDEAVQGQLRRWSLSDLLFQSDNQKSIEDYIFVSPAPAEVAAKYATNPSCPCPPYLRRSPRRINKQNERSELNLCDPQKGINRQWVCEAIAEQIRHLPVSVKYLSAPSPGCPPCTARLPRPRRSAPRTCWRRPTTASSSPGNSSSSPPTRCRSSDSRPWTAWTGDAWHRPERRGQGKPPVHRHPHRERAKDCHQRICSAGGFYVLTEVSSFFCSLLVACCSLLLAPCSLLLARSTSSRSGRARWTGRPGRWQEPSSSLSSSLR